MMGAAGKMDILVFLDVGYSGDQALAACLTAEGWNADKPLCTYTRELSGIAPYEPGSFYKRELPCLLAVLEQVRDKPSIIVVDGNVWLPPDGRKGLGARLYDALGGGIPVVGIAKSRFSGADNCPAIIPVLRGQSGNPLYVSAAGMDPALAAEAVRGMAGKGRVPELLRLVDRLSRGL